MVASRNNPTFSIVTVVFNGEKVIEDTILSCLDQDYSLIEYILVDGASTDRTLTIIEKYKDQISNFVSEPDLGIYDAMNKGISLASGDWIIFMNAGDTFSNNSIISKIAAYIERETANLDVIYGDTLYSFQGNLLLIKPLPLEKINREMIACHQSIFVKTTLIKENKFNLKYRLAADYELLYKLYYQKKTFRYVNLTISIFNQDEGSTIKNLVQSTKERFSIQNDHGSFTNSFLMYSFIFKRQFSIFVKQLIPKGLRQYIFRVKNFNKIKQAV
jgi:glycosyltransferase involved in cell wall biosynthesis